MVTTDFPQKAEWILVSNSSLLWAPALLLGFTEQNPASKKAQSWEACLSRKYLPQNTFLDAFTHGGENFLQVTASGGDTELLGGGGRRVTTFFVRELALEEGVYLLLSQCTGLLRTEVYVSICKGGSSSYNYRYTEIT